MGSVSNRLHLLLPRNALIADGCAGAQSAVSMVSPRKPAPGLWTIVMVLTLALAFLGSRGIWDPDEGRYTNVAVNMLDSGDWLNPRRNDEVGHWTKPPLTYWAIASSVGVLGRNPWAARLPISLAYLLCVWLTWRIARRLAPGTETPAAVVYATMLLPFGASQLVTTDFILAACETLAVWAFVEARWGKTHSRAWISLMWAAFALAFLAKGPPGLLPLAVIVLCDRLLPGRRKALEITGIGLFAVLALPWYAAVVLNNPGLFEYFVGDEVVNRIATNAFGRNGQWYGWLAVYAPTLVLGTMPWTPSLWRWTRILPARIRRWRDPAAREQEAAMLLLAIWVLLPLAVFCLARSRLPLYVLPVFVPLAILIAIQRQGERRSLPHWGWLAAWCGALLALKLGAAAWPSHKNAAEWSDVLRSRTSDVIHEVVFIEDMARYGLRLHLNAEIEKVSLLPVAGARFNPTFDEDLATELAEGEPGVVYITKQALWAEIRSRIEAKGYRVKTLGRPYRERVMFTIAPMQGP